MTQVLRALLLGGVAVVAGCETTPEEPPSETYGADWDGVVALMDDHCVTCHTEGGIATDVFPDAVALDVHTGAQRFVVAGDPDASLLWRILAGNLDPDEPFEVMPQGTGPLDPALVEHVQAWIAAGAVVPGGDADEDGDGSSLADGDCDDEDPGVFPGAPETCNDVDDDCNGLVDDGAGDAWYPDSDLDGFGDQQGEIFACAPISSMIAIGGDCDDTDAAVRPDATEVCDGVDNDCDGTSDGEDAVDATLWYGDGDGDGFGLDADPVFACTMPTGAAPVGGDCDDTSAASYPGAPEICGDATDFNCDGSVATEDNDGDGAIACEDCDDGDATVFPGAIEVCDGIDNDCVAGIDDGFDLDGDGATTCGGDCDDGDASAFPGGVETWYDGVDGDCSGGSDYDQDGDGTTVVGAPEGSADDCDDLRGDIHVGVGVDLYDGVDNDCDGSIDEGPFAYDYETDIAPILASSCAGALCHDANRPKADLVLTRSRSYAELVGVVSVQAAPMLLVQPGDPAASYLVHKLEGTQISVGGSGVRMPKGDPKLPQAQRDAINAWILDGAPP